MTSVDSQQCGVAGGQYGVVSVPTEEADFVLLRRPMAGLGLWSVSPLPHPLRRCACVRVCVGKRREIERPGDLVALPVT